MKNRHFIYTFVFALNVLLLLNTSAVAKSQSSKVIDFESEVVEGMNKRPLDSLSHISDAERRKRRPHLYKKRAGFRAENQETMNTARYTK